MFIVTEYAALIAGFWLTGGKQYKTGNQYPLPTIPENIGGVLDT